jgi:hypothetical protein
MQNLREQLEGYRPGRVRQVTRSGASYQQTLTWTRDRLSDLIAKYQAQESHDQTTQLIRETFDWTLRTYHRYCIEGHSGAHYRQKALLSTVKTEFEHVIPERVIREAVFAGRLTLDQALQAPTCRLSKVKHDQLAKNKLRSSTPDPYWFWRRYQQLDVEIETRDGVLVDLDKWNIEDHFRYFA